LQMPDGRNVRVQNINPEYSETLTASMRAYVEVMEIARQALLRNEKFDDVYDKTWDAYKVHPDLADVHITKEQLEINLCEWKEMLIEEGYISDK